MIAEFILNSNQVIKINSCHNLLKMTKLKYNLPFNYSFINTHIKLKVHIN